MASTEQETEVKSIPQNVPARTQDEATLSTPVEMNSFKNDTSLTREETHHSTGSAQMPAGPSRVDTSTAIYQSQHPHDPPVTPPPVPAIHRTVSTAIGPSTDSPVPISKDTDVSGSSVVLTLLLTNGARHPFKLDGKYLAKRNVQVTENDPFNLSVYKLKELILREWRDEWEAKPSSPSSIRLISFGKLLDDKSSLKDLKLNPETPNVIHMTIKPQEFIEDEDAKGGKPSHTHSRDGTEGRSPGCRCVVM